MNGKSREEVKDTAPNILNTINIFELDYLLLQETHAIKEDHWRLKQQLHPHTILLDSITKRRKWGVATIINKKYKKSIISVQRCSVEGGRALAVTLLMNGRITTIVNVYLPTSPSKGESDRKSMRIEAEIEEWLKVAFERHHDIIFGGDINCDIDAENSARSRRLRRIFRDYDIAVVDTEGKPTHVGGNILDTFGVRIQDCEITEAGLVKISKSSPFPLRSDHEPLIISFKQLPKEQAYTFSTSI